jgi:hypothetical protein
MRGAAGYRSSGASHSFAGEERLNPMSHRRAFSLAVALLLLIAAAARWSGWPALLLAQDDANPESQSQIFLPFIAANPHAVATPEGSDTTAPNENGDGHNHIHVPGVPLLDSWPPQPVGLTDVKWVSDVPTDEIMAAQLQDDQAETIALASSAVRAALGDDYVHSATIRNHAKTAAAAGKAPAEVHVAYFSYSHNATVEVLVVEDQVKSVQTLDAATYQPEPTRQERTRAIAVARAHFLAQGETRVNELRGFVIQAYRSAGATGFYDTRVLYVTFHESLEERPEYLAWVDLSNQAVIKAVIDTYEQTLPAAEATAAANLHGEGQ